MDVGDAARAVGGVLVLGVHGDLGAAVGGPGRAGGTDARCTSAYDDDPRCHVTTSCTDDRVRAFTILDVRFRRCQGPPAMKRCA